MPVMAAEVRAAIVEDLRAGKSQNATARTHKVSPATVNGVAKAEGIPANIQAPRNAAAGRKVYNLEARLELSDKFFALIDRHLDGAGLIVLKDLAVTFAVLTDKRRLEEGKATERHEFTDDDREYVAGRIDELAARRRTRLAEDADAETGEAAAV